MPDSVAELRSRVDALPLRDRRPLHRRLSNLNRVTHGDRKTAAREAILADVERAEAALARRAATVPVVTYPAGLPIVERKDEIAAAIRDHQVVIVAGETGSGKTTQLPKICLELGRGVAGAIGHTQPRRIAARAVAERVATELDTPLGGIVGYKVRFTDRAHADTLVKVMTDGILLAELQQDRLLSGYDTIIVDEAHERSLNIDFILGYLKRLLPRRPDLKVIVTSATIDPRRFAEHFADAPIVEVSGRMYPVEVRYRPLVDGGDDDESDDDSAEPRDQISAISDAVDELCRHGPGDILVFLSGEREIRDTAEALRKHELRDVDVLPLYARLSSSEQHRVFEPHAGRRIVLATNVAETSLTVPGIRYVVDPGAARISRYSHRTKVQRLPIEPISQASAKQRAGRCGRVEAGVCIRLYSEEDFNARPEFTDPEILRTNLAAVILQMAALGLGDVAAFPFVEPPDRRNIKDGMALLHELGAIEQATGAPKLTAIGRKLAALPVDPRIARMVVHADTLGCVRETVVIAAALSIVDPRERPLDAQQAADQMHARFAEPDSDFLAYLKLWDYLRAKQDELSSSKFRRMCRKEFLNYLRVREWQDLVAQLRQVVRSIGIHLNDAPAPPQVVHQALLTGLLSHVGMRDVEKRDYLGARGSHFAVFPGSALFKKQPRWLMAAELVETTRLWGRVCARIEPEWVEPLAEHLVKRSYSEPHWDARRGAVMALEKVLLYGIPIVASRRVGYARVDPTLSRELFIRHALVEGDWQTRHSFVVANRSTLDEIAALEDRVRRRDLAVDEEALFELYDRRLPADVVSARHFDSWWKQQRRRDPDLLSFSREALMTPAAKSVDLQGFPDTWRQGDLVFDLSYRFSPGDDADGVTVRIPVAVLNRVVDSDFTWQVPGWREDLVVALIRALPKQLRRHFVPAPDVARELDLRDADDGSLETALARALWRRAGVEVTPDDFDITRLAPHLRVRFEIESDDGTALAAGRGLAALRERLVGSMRQAIGAASSEIERNGLRTWEVGALPECVEQVRAGLRVRGYPALVDQGNAVGVRVFETPAQADSAMRAGLRRLLSLNVASPAKALQRRLPNQTKLGLSRNAPGGVSELLDDCLACAIDAIVSEFGPQPRDEAAFARLLERVRVQLPDRLSAVVTTVVDVLSAAHEVEAGLKAAATDTRLLPALVDIRDQLGALVYRGFATQTGAARLRDLPRYLAAANRRLERLPQDVNRDRARMWEVEQAQQALREAEHRGETEAATLVEARWLIEELRVSLFAQALGTAQPVSVQRIARLLAAG